MTYVNTPLWLSIAAALACFVVGVALGLWFRAKQARRLQALDAQNLETRPRERQVELQRAMLLVLQDIASECVHHDIAVTNALAAQFLGREPGAKAVVMDMKYINETSAINTRISKLRDKIADPSVRRLADELTQQSRNTLRCNSVAEAKAVLKEIAVAYDLLNQTIARSLQSLDRHEVAS